MIGDLNSNFKMGYEGKAVGYYLELEQINPDRFSEVRVPLVFWALYALAGFAMACMGTAAFAVLGDLIESGLFLDQLLVGAFALAIIGYGLIGVKLAFVRKFIEIHDGWVRWGYGLAGMEFFTRKAALSIIENILIEHSGNTPNRAQTFHEDIQYYVQGHWRLVLRAHGREWLLDRNTDKEALQPLFAFLDSSRKNTTAITS